MSILIQVPVRWKQVIDRLSAEADQEAAQAIANLAQNATDDRAANAANRSGFRAYRAGPLSVTGATTILFDTKVFDYLNDYVPATGTWTPTVSGPYIITAGVGYSTNQADGTTIDLDIMNGTNRARYFYFNKIGGLVAPAFNGADVFNVTVGDTYTVRIGGHAAASPILAGDAATWFAALWQGR